jgi:hypothetical protein
MIEIYGIEGIERGNCNWIGVMIVGEWRQNQSRLWESNSEI